MEANMLKGQLRLVLALTMAWPAMAVADNGFRCGDRLADLGDHMIEVRNKCGEPDLITQRTEKRTVRRTVKVRRGPVEEWVTEEVEVEVPLDEWTYDLGPYSFIRFVTFENGRMVDVRTGDYGRKRTR
jgi:hypothetical protein